MYSRSEPMGWKPSGHPTVRRQRNKWVVRVEGIDTETGRRRPRQLGTYASQRTAGGGAIAVRRTASGDARHSGLVGPSLRRVAVRRDIEGTGAVRVGDTTHR